MINSTYPLARENLIAENLPAEFAGQGQIFRTQTNNSLKGFNVCFKPDEKFVSMSYAPQKGMKEYLVSQGFPAKDENCFTTKPEVMRKLFELIVANNNVDANEANRIRGLLNSNFTDTGIKKILLPSFRIVDDNK